MRHDHVGDDDSKNNKCVVSEFKTPIKIMKSRKNKKIKKGNESIKKFTKKFEQ